MKVDVLVTQSCPSLCHPVDCRLPGSSVHGIFQTRILEWVAIPFYRGSSRPRDPTSVSSIAERFFTICATRDNFTLFICNLITLSFENILYVTCILLNLFKCFTLKTWFILVTIPSELEKNIYPIIADRVFYKDQLDRVNSIVRSTMSCWSTDFLIY